MVSEGGELRAFGASARQSASSAGRCSPPKHPKHPNLLQECTRRAPGGRPSRSNRPKRGKSTSVRGRKYGTKTYQWSLPEEVPSNEKRGKKGEKREAKGRVAHCVQEYTEY